MTARERALPVLLAMVPALIVVALVDAMHVPGAVYGHELSLAPQVFGLALLGAFPHLLLPIGFQLVAVALLVVPDERWPFRHGKLVGLFAASALFCAGNYVVILLDRLPFLWLVTLPYLALAGSMTVSAATLPPPRQGRLAKVAWLIPGAGVLGFVVVTWLNQIIFFGGYPALHLGMLQISYVLLHLGFAHLFARVRWSRLRLGVIAATVGAGMVVALWGGVSGAGTPYFRHYTVLGQAPLALSPLGDDPKVDGPPLQPDPGAEARFGDAHNLPSLPDDFDLTKYNVLMITSEATAMRRTSLLGKSSPDTTPHVRAWSRDRALVFTRAYAPSSNTMQSLASLFTMTYPSAVRLETYHRRWLGKVLDDNLTVAELFSSFGHKTFWAGGDFHRMFSRDRGIMGIGQGLADRNLVANDGADADKDVATAAVAALEKHKGARFFGWVHFVGPHSPYDSHYPDLPGGSSVARYRQELRYTDEQIGRVLAALKRLKLTRKTIVIITSDHGEEFGEHGGKHHGSNVNEEAVHVPLVIAIPGVAGRVSNDMTSTMYVFPWLLLKGSDAMRTAVRARLSREIGPMLSATGNAVVVEVLGHDRMKSALIYPRHKYHYDYFSRLIQVYDLAGDPDEQTDMHQSDPAARRRAVERLRAYRRVRYYIRNVRVGR